MTKFALHAKTLYGLENVLAAELAELGATEIKTGNRLVMFAADQRLMYRANACCRTAIRFLKPIAHFRAETERELYTGVQSVDWSELLDAKHSLWIDPFVHSSFLTHSLYAAQLAKDAIVDEFRERSGDRPSVERNNPDLRIGLHLVNNQATVYLDSSGDSLHFRGYRREKGEAPLNEVLAAGILRMTEWDRASPVIDPMCGSGTFLIEAALLARNVAPVLLGREFGFAKWRDFDRRLFQSVYDEARAASRDKLPFPLTGGDIDPQVIGYARENARWAGVQDDIQFDVASFEVASPPGAGATLVTNPPYDERMKVDRLAGLYRRIGDALKQRFAGCKAWVFTGNLEAASQIGLRASRRIKLFNGPIECRLLKFDLYEGSKRADRSKTDDVVLPAESAEHVEDVEPSASSSSREAAPAKPARADLEVRPAGAQPARWLAQGEMFRNRLARMAKHWHKWARRQNITCFRLYDKDIPDVPLAIDWYEGHLHIAEYARPHDRAEAEHRAWLEFIVDAAAATLEVPRERVFVKHRQRQKGLAQYERQADRRHFFQVHEGGHKFWVNLSDYLDTGLFLDHRQTRAMVQGEAAGKHFLNLFGYTGSFSVYAAAGGAASTTTVDLSNTYLDWARDNLKLNGFTQPTHQFIREDALAFLEQRAGSRQPPFDLAVVDPPTFSNSKRTDDVWDVQRHHIDLLQLLLKQMTPKGKIYFSTNLRRFKLDEESLAPNADIREITNKTIPEDYRNKRIHRAWTLVRRENSAAGPA